ncbi:MAG TPA: carbonic anhydrase family protein [Chitinophagales bacterium]|nr:carbonic anhydrase family protein [Chitinophagales bacterium]
MYPLKRFVPSRFALPGLLLAVVLTASLSSCNEQTESAAKKLQEAALGSAVDLAENQLPSDATVLTSDEQKALTPEAVLAELKAGNQRFVDNNPTRRDYAKQVKAAAAGQYPKAVVISCLDSRVPVEDLFDQSIGDLFVGRVAGNFVDEDFLGSMEFACKVAGAKAIVVMGHQHCGAVKGAIDNVKLGNLTAMLAKIQPAVTRAASGFSGERTAKNDAFVQRTAEENVRYGIEQIRANSPILKGMEDNGEIKIVGAFYSLDTGAVTVLN